METFFYDDQFLTDLGDLITHLDLDGEDVISKLPEDWTCKVELTDKEPIFKVDARKLLELLCDSNEERLSEDFDNYDESKILKALNESCDFEKLKTLLPKYHYPNNKFITITKKDLLEYIK